MIREKQRLIDLAEVELKKLLLQENELLDLYHDGLVPKADFGRRLKPLSERRAQIEEELPRLEAQRDVLKIGMVSNEEILEDTKDLANRWPDLPWERRRQIVEAITDRLVISKEGVEVALLQVPFGDDDKLGPYPR